MYMMKIMNRMLMALLMVGISINFTSCKEDELTEEEKQQQAEQELEEALEWWDVVSQLTDVQELPDEWQTATFEPAIGKALESDPYTRVIATNDLATAAQRFAYLTGASVDETTPDYTWSHKDAGSLTYHAGSTAGTYLAQVDVNLKQMPRLKKILYQTTEQMGENASGDFSGTAYYRFGDVVKKKRSDGMYDYWICVRPAFSLESKGDSHWVCITNPLPNENIYSWTKNDITWNVPTKLGENKEHMQNFAELIYAILDPVSYRGNLANAKLKTFHDFDREKFNTYHGQNFWKRVSQAWDDNNFYRALFYQWSKDDFKRMIEQDGLTLLYKGYSWKIGWTCSLWQANYKNDNNNMHTATYTTPSCNMKDITFDANQFFVDKSYYTGFFNDNKTRYIVRYAKGETLCKDEKGKGSYDVKTKLSHCEDVYVYNSYFYQNEPSKFCELGAEPETEDDILGLKAKLLSEVAKEDRGKFIGQNGKIYNSRQDALSAGTKAMGLIIDTYDTLYTCIEDYEVKREPNRKYERETYGYIRHGIGIALEDGNRSSVRNAEKNVNLVAVQDFDNTWYQTHEMSTGTWLVPNAYHWQRLVLPYITNQNDRKIYLQNYLSRHMYDMTMTSMNDIAYSDGLCKQLSRAGASLKTDYPYYVANGWCDGDEEDDDAAYGIRVDNGNLVWSYDASSMNVRYVLVW